MAEHEKEPERASVGLKKAREDRGWSQAELAKRAKADVKTVRRWENGKSTPYEYECTQLAAALEMTLEEIKVLLAESRVHLLQKQSQVHPPYRLWMIDHWRTPYFTGRDELLERLHILLQTESSILLTHAITGLGGVGKTMLAVEYAYRYYEDFREYNVVLWAQASSSDDLFAAFTAMAKALDLPEKQEQDQQVVVEAVKQWLITHTDWLLILDNVEDLQIIPAFLPQSKTGAPGHVLLTTRCQAVGTVAASVLEVTPMGREEGITFLLRRAKKLAINQQLDQAEEENRAMAQVLFQELAGLPLALDQAGAYIEEAECTLLQYMERYQIERASLLRRRGAVTQQDTHPASVMVTFLLSLKKIEQVHRAAASLLRLCAFLAPDDIPEDLFRRGSPALPFSLQSLIASPVAFDEAIATIRRYSLIQRLATKRSLAIHRVVQAVIADDLEEHQQREGWEKATVALVAHVFARTDSEDVLAHYEPYIPHALASVDLIHRRTFVSHPAGHLLFLMSTYLTRHARYEQAEALCHEAMRLYQQLLGPAHPEIAVHLTNLAHVYEEKRLHTKAQVLYEQALAVLEQARPPQPLNKGIALANVSRCYRFQRKLANAEQCARQALSLLKHAAGPESQAFADGLVLLASIFRDQGKHVQAEALYQHALTRYTSLLPPQHPSIGHCLDASATNYAMQGEDARAVELFQQAISIFEAACGKQHPDVAGCLYRLADTYLKLKQFDQAEVLHKRALAIYEHVGGPGFLEINQPLFSLALLSHVRGEHAQAELLYQRAIAVIEQSQEPEHSDLIPILESYAQLLLSKGEIGEATRLMRRAKAIEQTI